MADIKDQLIKDSYNYILQSDLSSGFIYRIGGSVPVNPVFSSGLTINDSFIYSGAGEQNGYALLTDGTGYAYWGPVSGASPSSGVTSITVGNGLSASSSTGAVTISFTGSTSTSGDYLPLSGGTVSGEVNFTNGLTANTISATNYYNLPYSGTVTGGGTTNYVPKWTGSTGLGNSQIFDNGTNVGIGTTSPSARLDVSGDTLLRSGVTLSNLSSSANTRFIVSDSNGVLSYRTDVLTGTTITITGGTNIQINGTYPNFGIDFTGTTGSGGPTLVASNTCVIPADGNQYNGSNSVGWGYFQWDAQYEDPIRQRNVTNGIPLPKDVNKNGIIRVCGIAYCDASVPENDTLEVILSYFICGDLKVNLISQSGYTYQRDGTVCFNLEAIYRGLDTLLSCETFLILGFSSSLSDASQIKISYTIKIE